MQTTAKALQPNENHHHFHLKKHLLMPTIPIYKIL